MKQNKVFPVSRFGQFINRYKTQGCGIHTVTHTGGRRPVVKYMTEMRHSMPAENLCPHREEASVFPLDNIFLIDRFGKARPAGAGIELVSRAEKRLSCDDIHIQSRFL